MTRHDINAIIPVYPSAIPINPFAWNSILTPRIDKVVPCESKLLVLPE